MVFVTFPILALAALVTRFATAAPAPAFVTVIAPFEGPDNDTTPLTASIVGVDSQGHTTYAIDQPAVQDKTSTLAAATGTLIEGSDYVSYTYAVSAAGLAVTAGVEFSVKDGKGIATGLDESSHAATATLSSLPVWVLDIPPTGSPGGPQATGKPSSAQRTSVSVLSALVGLAVAFRLV